jgi:hypothetical protein
MTVKTVVRGLLAVGLFASATLAVAGSDVVLDALLQRPAAEHGTVVVPDRFLRSWDPLTVFFDTARGPGAGPEDHPGSFVTMSPAHEGAWTWLDAKTLQFRPAEAWPPLTVYTVKAGGKTAYLSTLLAPPISVAPTDGSVGLDPVDTITLTFSEPVDPKVLARNATIEIRALPGLGEDPVTRLHGDDFEVKVLDRPNRKDPAQYSLVLRSPIPAGHRAVVRIGLALDEGADEAVFESRFDTAEPFRPVELGCPVHRLPISPEGTQHPSERPVACAGPRAVQVAFTAALDPLDPVQARNLVRLEPTVDDLSYQVAGSVLEIHGDFQPDLPYRVSLAPTPIRDTTGRTLDIRGESVVWLYFPKQPAFLRWGAGQGIAERKGRVRIPVEGRGVGTADLRIFRVDPLNQNFWPFPDSPIPVDESQAPPGPGEQPEVVQKGGSGNPARYLPLLGSPAWSGLVTLPVDPESDAARFGLDITDPLARVRGAGQPGTYLVGLRRLDGTTTRSWVRVQVTDLVLTTVENPTDVMFQVTSLSDGQPVGGASVRIEGNRGASSMDTLFEGKTDGQGLLRFPAPGGNGGVTVRRLVVSKDDDVLVLDPRRAPDRFANGTWLPSYGDPWLQWAWGSLADRGEPARTLVHLFPDRPVYRPGDEVNLKGYARVRAKGHLTAVTGTGTVVIDGPGQGNWRLPVELSGNGSFYAKWKQDSPPTGAYTATFLDKSGTSYGTTSFRVEAYRLPTFEVKLNGPANQTTVPNDQPFDVGLVASYYAGGKVAARPVRWRVTQFPYAWSPGKLAGFAWSADDRYGMGGAFRATPELAVDGTTGPDGSATLPLDPGVEADARPRTYVVEATVTGADDQTVTDTVRIDAVPAFVLGLQVPRFLDHVDKIPAQVVAVGPDGKPVSGIDATVRLVHREWHSVLQASDFTSGEAKYLTDVVDVPSGEQRVRTGGGPIAVPLPIQQPGVWLVEVEARDQLGRVQLVRVDLYAGGEGAVAWEKPKAGTFELTPDQPSYKPGQTANVLVRSPFQTGDALVIVEAPAGNRYLQVPVRGGKATVSFPVETGWVPRLPVHVILRRGRVDVPRSSDGQSDLGKPQTVGATVWLSVQPVENQVVVTVSNPARSLPGKTVPVTVKLADPDGKPLAGEVTLWLVDQAVLALGQEQRLDPLPDFVLDRGTWVSVRDTRNLAFGLVPTAQMPGGDGDDEGGDEVLDKATIRKDFRPLAYYEPSLQVPASGSLTVQVALPDNLTVFKIRAKAISGPERFGVGTGEIAVRLPVIVEPALPRFVRPGDSFEAAALARVIEGAGGPGKAQIEVSGMKATGPLSRDVTLDQTTALRLAWPVVVDTPKVGEDGKLAAREVTVKTGISRTSDGATDAFLVTLPLRDDRQETYSRQLVTIPAGGTVAVPAIPEEARAGSVRRSIVVARDDGLTRMAAGLDLLRHGPADDTGSKLARARTAVGLGTLRGPLGLEDDAEIRGVVEDAEAWLPTVLDPHGLVAGWPGGQGRVWMTADALAFLADAADAGYPVDDRVRHALEQALTAGLRSDYPYFLSSESWMERTTALWGLSVDGKFDQAYFDELIRNSRFLVPEAQARVLLAAARAGQTSSASATQLTDLLQGEILTELYQGKPRYAGLKGSSTSRSPLIAPSETRELATVVDALARVRPDADPAKLATDALIRLGQGDGWGQPNADAAAILALATRFRDAKGPAVTVEYAEGTSKRSVALGADAPAARTTSTQGVAASLRNTGSAPVTALIVTRWIPAADGSQQAAVQSGFVVEREWLAVQKDGAPPVKTALAAPGTTLQVRVGDVIEEHVRLVNPADRYDVVLTVPLAAGLEPLNPALATSGPEAKPANRSTAPSSWVSYGDDRALYAFDALPKGTYDVYFRTRATVAGTFVQPSAEADQVYDRSVTGLSPGAKVVVGN